MFDFAFKSVLIVVNYVKKQPRQVVRLNTEPTIAQIKSLKQTLVIQPEDILLALMQQQRHLQKMFHYPFPAPWKPHVPEKKKNLKPAVICFNVASNSAIKRHSKGSPFSRSPAPASACSPQGKATLGACQRSHDNRFLTQPGTGTESDLIQACRRQPKPPSLSLERLAFLHLDAHRWGGKSPKLLRYSVAIGVYDQSNINSPSSQFPCCWQGAVCASAFNKR